jgi:hypothetical protein
MVNIHTDNVYKHQYFKQTLAIYVGFMQVQNQIANMNDNMLNKTALLPILKI